MSFWIPIKHSNSMQFRSRLHSIKHNAKWSFAEICWVVNMGLQRHFTVNSLSNSNNYLTLYDQLSCNVSTTSMTSKGQQYQFRSTFKPCKRGHFETDSMYFRYLPVYVQMWVVIFLNIYMVDCTSIQLFNYNISTFCNLHVLYVHVTTFPIKHYFKLGL